MTGTPFSIVVTTCPSEAAAREIARALVDGKLAGCVQFWPIRSVYRWNDEVAEEPEILLLVKARSADFARVAAEIGRLHAYEVPEILRVDVEDGAAAYLAWLERATTR